MDTHLTLERLTDYHGGAVSAEDGQWIEEHLDECAACARRYAEILSRNGAGVGGAGDDAPRPLSLPAELENALKQFGTPGSARAKSSSAQIPTIDGYEIIDEIGRGGMGVVYKAIRLKPKQVVAIKVIAAGAFAAAEEIERFHREAEAMARFHSTDVKVVRVLEHGECHGLHYISMELIDGGPLSARLAKQVLPPEDAARIVAEVAHAVHTLHQSGIIHRDIKPDNILLQPLPGASAAELSTATCTPLLTDFGVAKKVGGSELTQAHQIVGTPDYMAPEMIRSSHAATPAADVYSLGATLYACLVGVSPFKAASPFDTLKRVEMEYPASIVSRNRAVPLSLQWICLKALEKDPARRYPDAADLAADLRRALAGKPDDPVRAGPPTGWVRASRFVAMNRRLVVATGFIVILLAATTLISVQRLLVIGERAQQETDLRIAAQKVAETQRKAAHDAQVTSARERARRGDWVAALPEFDRVIEDDEPDAVHLRIERLVGYFALNNTSKLVEELDALERSQLGNMAAQVKLIRAAWLLCDDKRPAEGRALARAAWHDRDHLFSKADVAFAEALAAERVGQAIGALRKAVAEDPLHYLASNSLIVALAAVGDLEEARRQIQFARGMFPFSPAPDVADALVALIENDPAGLKASLAKAADKFPAERRKELAGAQKYLLLVNDLQNVATRMAASENDFAFLLDAFRAGVLIGKIYQMRTLPNDEPLILPVPTVSLYFSRLADILKTYVEVGSQARELQAGAKMLPRLKALNDDYPDSGLLVLTAIVHMQLSLQPLDTGNIPEARKHLDAMADLCARATKAPNLLPHSSVRYLARSLGAFSDLGVLKIVPDAEPNLNRVRETLHGLVSEGEKWPKLRREVAVKYVQLTTVPLTAAQCGAWRLDDPAGKAAFEKRRRDLAALAKILLDDWAISESNTAAIAQLRQDLAKMQQSPGVLGELGFGKNKK